MEGVEMKVTKLITLFLAFIFAFISFNCSDDDDDNGIIPERYVGTWEAKITLEGTLIEYAPEEDPDNGVDVRFLGGEIKAIMSKDGTYSLTFIAPGEEPDEDAGTITLNEEDKIITMNSNSDEDLIFQYEWEDDILVLVTIADFDFTLQGNPPTPAIVTIKLKRTAT
jgi:hypothetical protein